MSDLRPNNGGGVPPDDGGAHRGGLPDLPPEWGTIVIPDDAAELDAEATALRRELRRHAWTTRLRRMSGLGSSRLDATSLGVPLVIMAVAVITTLLSLFVVTWDHRRNATAPVGPEAGLQQASVSIAEVTLADVSGSRVRVGNLVPAILLLVEECDCTPLITAVAGAAPPPITVVPITSSAPCVVGTVKNVRCLVDPTGVIIGRYPTASEALATAQPSLASPSAAPPAPSGSVPVVGPTTSELRPMAALAVPVDAEGNAGEPILVMSPGDLGEAFKTLLAGD